MGVSPGNFLESASLKTQTNMDILYRTEGINQKLKETL
jgi:hypothetical protein